MEKLLTISVAAYNMEKYLERCLQSLVVPEIMDGLEVFVIDDGSTDATLSIAESYTKRYPNTFITVHQDNGGYGTTVNYSIAHANGKYFKLLDADDWYDQQGFVELIETLRTTNVDVVVTTKFASGSEPSSMKTRKLASWHGESIIDVKDISPVDINGWEISYRTEALKSCNLNLPPHLLYTDSYYFTIPFAVMRSVQYVDCLVYCYFIGRDGQSTSRESEIRHVQEKMRVTEDLCTFCQQKILEHNKNIPYIRQRVALSYNNTLRMMLLQKICKETLDQLIQYEMRIKKVCPDIYIQSRKLPGKTAMLLRLFSKTNYKAFWLLRLLPGGLPNVQ